MSPKSERVKTPEVAATEPTQLEGGPGERLRGLLSSAIASMLREGLNHSESARLYWQTTASKYRERWAQGDLDGILPLMPDLLSWLREAGIDPARNSDVVALFNDPSFERIRDRITPGGCNPKLLEMFRQMKDSVESAPLLKR